MPSLKPNPFQSDLKARQKIVTFFPSLLGCIFAEREIFSRKICVAKPNLLKVNTLFAKGKKKGREHEM